MNRKNPVAIPPDQSGHFQRFISFGVKTHPISSQSHLADMVTSNWPVLSEQFDLTDIESQSHLIDLVTSYSTTVG